jgi:hypothetical protein
MSGWAPSEAPPLRMIALVLGCVLLASMARGLRRGATPLIYRNASRQEAPILYWTGIIIYSVGGAALVLAAVFPQLERF